MSLATDLAMSVILRRNHNEGAKNVSDSVIYPLTIERLPFEKYRELHGENASSLIHALDSAKAYRFAKDNPREDNDTYRAGRAAHTAVLEPMRFLKEYVIWEGGDRRGKAWEEFKAKNEGKTILKPELYDPAVAQRDAVMAHPIAGALFREPGRGELTIQWRHRSGLLCKSRIDWLCSALVDLKTTSAKSPEQFERQAYDLKYHVRMAFYLDACRAIGVDAPVKLVVVPKAAPHDVYVTTLDPALLDAGREEYERAIDLVQSCQKTGVWPGRAEREELSLKLPAWAQKFDEEEALTYEGATL